MTVLVAAGRVVHAAEPPPREPSSAAQDAPATSAPPPSTPSVGPATGATSAPGAPPSSAPSPGAAPSTSSGASAPSAATGTGAHAGEAVAVAEEVLLLRTAIVGASESSNAGARPSSRELSANAQAQKLDVLLGDAIQDLGLTLGLSERSTQEAGEVTDVELLARAAKTGRWVIYPSIDPRGSELVVRLAGVAPGTKTVIVRAESVKPADLAVRAVVMLRDVVSKRPAATPSEPATRGQPVEPRPSFAVPARSQGRATLAFNSALFGGFVGYAVQRGSGGDDPRLLFPLMALGTGLGLGASAIVAEEWDVGLGDAWYLSAGAWWPAMSGLFIARSARDGDPSQYGYSLVGALTGLGLATTSLAIGGSMSEGGALLTHSGGAFGLVLGGMTELAIRDNGSSKTPYAGLGIGTGAGVLVAGAAARWLTVEPSRVLIIDLGAGLGGLAGAAAASPFIVRDRTEGGDRAFLVTTMATTVAGGVVAWLWTRKSTPAPPATALYLPHIGIGVIAASLPGFGPNQPVFGLDVSGPLP